MKRITVLFAMLLAVALVGCGKQPESKHIVILIDVSGSIDRQALDQAFKAIDELVGYLNRGDRIAIIPILGDAAAEASGRIIRFDVPTNRQAYDSDLQAFRQKLKTSLAALKTEAVVHPGTKTDILGSVALAEQEFASVNRESARLLLILSDFIQEDQEINFMKGSHTATVGAARGFATQITKGTSNLKGIRVYMGLLRSTEYSAMGRSRREAIQEFWIRYFKSCNGNARFLTDGPGLLNKIFNDGQ
jgi:hypothetical protein